MRSESFVLTVLPLTTRSGAPFHVSLHIAPRLIPEGDEEPLGHFTEFAEWAAKAHAAAWTLFGPAAISATPRTGAIDPALWAHVFPPDTPVRAPRFDTMANRTWRSFPLKTAAEIGALLPLLGTMFFPIDKPDLKDWVKGVRGKDSSPVARLISELGDGDGSGDVALTRALDKEPGSTPLDKRNRWAGMLAVLHAARRYYERPEAQTAYRSEPDPKAQPVPTPRPTPDFHERVAHLADQPELLRRLGLVIDIHVDDLVALKATATLHAGVSKITASVTASRTPVSRLADHLLTVPRSGEWDGGRLKLGDQDQFSVIPLDGDGAALKAERFIRSLPKMLKVAVNGDAGDVAPPAVRSEGLTVARTNRLASVKAQLAAAGAMAADPLTPPTVATEDVTRGYRVQIWDDHVKAWFSPHRRLATATVAGLAAPVYTDRPEFGMIQTAGVNETPNVPDSPVYLHEAVFGWSGWSLSAPRPGPRAAPELGADGKQIEIARVAEAPAKGITPVAVTTRVAPGTLPRLRYGRSYMFRAWSVDLAGNSPGDPIAPATTGVSVSFDPGLAAALGRLPAGGARPLAAALPGIHALAVAAAGRSANSPAAQIAAFVPHDAQPPGLTGMAHVDAIAVNRLRSRAAKRTRPPVTTLALDEMLASVSVEPAAAPRARSLEPVIRAELGATTMIDPSVLVDLTDTSLTPLTPFRRWDPVPPPVVVARHRLSIAESIHHLVIRSGVTVAPDPAGGDATTIVPPAAFIAATPPALAADFRTTSERHLAAPKGSQVLNERHGRFDPALGTATAAERTTFLAAALRDDGTLFDTDIVALDDPNATVAQPGVSLQAGPEVTNPETDLSTLQGANRGNAPLPNHYVVHDVDDLALPWLPDPMAAGVAFGMSTANAGSPLLGAFRVESTAAPYHGEWPAPQPFRLVLTSASEVTARIEGRVVTIGLPPGRRLDLRLSSSLKRADLPLFALWGLLPAAWIGLDVYARPAADGQFWALTPSQPLSLVHAVPRPVLAPLNTVLFGARVAGETGASFGAVIDIDAASTDRIDAEAIWSEWIDDLAADGPVREDKRATPFHAQVAVDEDMVVFGATEGGFTLPDIGHVAVHRGRHEFGDTRHRTVDYAFRATTRFREYFPPTLLATAVDCSVVGAATQISLPSTAVPAAPTVDSVIPLFRWDAAVDPGQPFGIRRRRRSGLRVYLQRPWFTTGDDEQLAVIVMSDRTDDRGHASVWGGDPVWFNIGPANTLVGLSINDLYGAVGLDDVRGPDPRLSPAAVLTAPDGAHVAAIGYRPEYNPDRKLWFVDVAIAPAAAMWPFVRLAVARYQPNSLPGLELSRIVQCDFAQLPPERTLTVSRPDTGTVRVSVTGPAGVREGAPDVPSVTGGLGPAPATDPGSLGPAGPYPFGATDPTLAMAQDRRVYARVEHRAADLVSDLDWSTVDRQELSLAGVSALGDFAWTGTLPLATALPLVEPGANHQWRVTVEEYEGIDGDPADPDGSGPLVKQWRLIYADRSLL